MLAECLATAPSLKDIRLAMAAYALLEAATRIYGRRRGTLDRIEAESGQRLGGRQRASTAA
jgi:hypothetical protein